MTIQVRTATNTRIKTWFRQQRVSQRRLANLLGITPATANGKVNGWISWTQHDLQVLNREFGLSSDFVIGLSDIEPTQPLVGAERS